MKIVKRFIGVYDDLSNKLCDWAENQTLKQALIKLICISCFIVAITIASIFAINALVTFYETIIIEQEINDRYTETIGKIISTSSEVTINDSETQYIIWYRIRRDASTVDIDDMEDAVEKYNYLAIKYGKKTIAITGKFTPFFIK
jgi:hypothetical protein